VPKDVHHELDRLTVTRAAGVPAVVLHGEQDVFSAIALRDTLRRLLETSRAVAVDLTAVHRVDDAIVAVLIAAQRRAVELGTGFAVALTDERAEAVLGGICPRKLAARLTLVGSRAAAVVAAAQPAALAA
jgi:anti-anti-sigma regulatory factor